MLCLLNGLQLMAGLYYPSAIENAASAMEVMAVAGRNAALLVKQQVEMLERWRDEGEKRRERIKARPPPKDRSFSEL